MLPVPELRTLLPDEKLDAGWYPVPVWNDEDPDTGW
jgi:hypothetical protein